MTKPNTLRNDRVFIVLLFTFLFGGVVLLTLGRGQSYDPLTRLEQAARHTPPAFTVNAQITPPSALPNTQIRLEFAAYRLRAPIVYASIIGNNELGHVIYATREVVIEETLNADMRTFTLAHELAHILEPGGLDPAEREVWAESVAYLVCRDEDDRLTQSAAYIARFKTRLQVLEAYRDEMLFATAFLKGEVE